MNRLWLPALTLLLLAPLLFLGCAKAPDPWEKEPGSPRVVVTIAPLYSFVRAVAGDRAAIQCLCTTTGPHHYETDHANARLLEQAHVVFAVGLQLDDGFTGALHKMSGRHDLPVVKLGKRLPPDRVKKMRQHKHEPKAEGGGHAHHHGEFDPHVWLGVEEVVRMVEVIRDELSAVDPDHKDEYRKNAEAYVGRLKQLHADGRKLLADKKVRRIVSFHDAFEYFAASFGLEVADVIELAPGDSPSAGHLAKVEELCSDPKRPVGAITVEPQYPDSTSAKQLQTALRNRKVAVDLVSIDPLETADAAELKKEGAGWYEARMRRNLEALAKVLK